MPHLESPQFSFSHRLRQSLHTTQDPFDGRRQREKFCFCKGFERERGKQKVYSCVPSPLGPVISFLLFYHCKSYAPGASTLRFLAPASKDAKMMRVLMGNTRRRVFFSLRELCKCCLQGKKNWPEWMVCAYG